MKLYEAINRVLKAIGEIPMTSEEEYLTADASSDIGRARDTVLGMSKIIQQEGYWFNLEKGYPMSPSPIDGTIAIGDNILAVVDTRYIVKDHKLYDVTKRTSMFTSTIKVDVIFEIPFDDLPFVVADVITREASVAFYNDVMGDTQELKVLEMNAQRGQVALQKAQFKHKRANLMKGSRLVDRTQNPRAL